jgi:uncharacterized protein YndB with AHSA1/START domain
MPVKKDASGRRSVQAEVEVPGTPEEVWQAIATGPGISSWFVPSEVDGRVGGTAVSHFGPGNSMDSAGTITTWEPPRRFVVETKEGPGPVASEWTVETRSGGTCVVRVVHSWFASSDDWDNPFEGHEHGWRAFFNILRRPASRMSSRFRWAGRSFWSCVSISTAPALPRLPRAKKPCGSRGWRHGFRQPAERSDDRRSGRSPNLSGAVIPGA